MRTILFEFRPMTIPAPFDDVPTPATGRRPTLSRVVAPDDLTIGQRDRMFDLMSHYFDQVARPRFEADLHEKDSVVLIEDDTGVIQGFTTLRILWSTFQEEPIAAVYSGDTLLSPEYLGERGWLSTWARYVFARAKELPAQRVYWIFLAATYRSYQFLPGFFQEYYPHPDRPTPPAIAAIVEGFIRQKFDDPFDPASGIVSLREPTPYRDDQRIVSPIPPDDPVARFFVARNPGYLSGDLLACITTIDPANVTRVGRRVLGWPGY